MTPMNEIIYTKTINSIFIFFFKESKMATIGERYALNTINFDIPKEYYIEDENSKHPFPINAVAIDYDKIDINALTASIYRDNIDEINMLHDRYMNYLDEQKEFKKNYINSYISTTYNEVTNNVSIKDYMRNDFVEEPISSMFEII